MVPREDGFIVPKKYGLTRRQSQRPWLSRLVLRAARDAPATVVAHLERWAKYDEEIHSPPVTVPFYSPVCDLRGCLQSCKSGRSVAERSRDGCAPGIFSDCLVPVRSGLSERRS